MRGENEGALGYLSRGEPSNGKSGQGLPTEKGGGGGASGHVVRKLPAIFQCYNER